MGCIWSSRTSEYCSRCNVRETRTNVIIDGKCQQCTLKERSFYTPSRDKYVRSDVSVTATKFCSRCFERETRTNVIVNGKCQQCTIEERKIYTPSTYSYTAQKSDVSVTTQTRAPTVPKPIHNKTRGLQSNRPLYGEFKCLCGRHWVSRFSWSGKYQNCTHCDRTVYSHAQRELKQSDLTKKDVPHPQNHCQKCMELGHYCGLPNLKRKTFKTRVHHKKHISSKRQTRRKGGVLLL